MAVRGGRGDTVMGVWPDRDAAVRAAMQLATTASPATLVVYDRADSVEYTLTF